MMWMLFGASYICIIVRTVVAGFVLSKCVLSMCTLNTGCAHTDVHKMVTYIIVLADFRRRSISECMMVKAY